MKGLGFFYACTKWNIATLPCKTVKLIKPY